jgi:protein O-GlcNAcase/histone acetyltransferase
MSQQDKDRFSSFAHAQVAVANEIYDYLDKPNILLFCPTGKHSSIITNIYLFHLIVEYCSRMAKPSLEKSSYLQTIGNGLHPDIDIFWTGNSLAEDFTLDLRFLIVISMTSSVVDRVDKI